MSRQIVAVVTGASSGIGKVTAMALAARGWNVIGLGRDAQRCADSEREIAGAAAKGGTIMMVRADLSILTQAARAAREVAALTDHIDVLINNAGGTARVKVVTSEGNEESFAANHLGPFVLTRALLPLLRTAVVDAPKGQVRVLTTSSSAGEMAGGIDWDDLQLLGDGYDSGRSYCNAKLVNMMFSAGLARRVADDGIVAHAIHPGPVDTNFFAHGDPAVRDYVVRTMGLLTPEQGADTMIWLATADEPGRSTGHYYHERKPRAVHPLAVDVAAIDRLWAESERLTGVPDAGESIAAIAAIGAPTKSGLAKQGDSLL